MKDLKIKDSVLELIDSQIKEDGKFDVEVFSQELEIYISGNGSFVTYKDETGYFNGEVSIHNIKIEVYKDGEEIELSEELEKVIHSQLPRN